MPSPIEYINKLIPAAPLSGFTTSGWYFWEECFSKCHGPFKTYHEAEDAALDHFRQLMEEEARQIK